jgi:hypothetical protein
VIFNGAPLNLPASQFGVSRGGGAHAPNEWFLIKSSNPKVNGLDEATWRSSTTFTLSRRRRKRAGRGVLRKALASMERRRAPILVP